MKPGCTFAALTLALVIATALVTSQAVSQEDPLQPPSQEEMMKLWAETMKVGTPHKWLAKLAGNWTTETTAWMGGPGSPPVKMKGKAELEMILGGRFLEMETEGDFMGQPWESLGLIGYDNFEKRFVSIWADSGGTGITSFSGHSNRDGKTIRLYGPMNEPTLGMVGKHAMFQYTLQDADTLVITGYDFGIAHDAKVIEIVCKRVKASEDVEEDETEEME